MIQIQHLYALANRPRMSRHHHVAVKDNDRRGRQLDPQPMPNEPRRHTVLTGAHHDLRIPVHPRGQGQRGIERLVRQRPQQLTPDSPIVPNTHDPVADTSPIIGIIDGFK